MDACSIFKLSYRYVLLYIIYGIFIQYGKCEKDLRFSTRTFSTRYGMMQGMTKEYNSIIGLDPVDRILSIMYATTKTTRLRFMPASSPLEKWTGIRMPIHFRSTCVQKIRNEENLRNVGVPDRLIDRLLKVEAAASSQTEDCLTLNLYIPTTPGESCSYIIIMCTQTQSASIEKGFSCNFVVSFGY